jgi:hypothetical protein
MLAPGDLNDISEFLNITSQQLLDQHLDLGAGAKMARVSNTGVVLEIFRVRTLVPKRNEKGFCHWFIGGLCSIHSVSPFGCRFFDTHMSREEGDKRSKYATMHLIPNSPEYQAAIAAKLETANVQVSA